MFIKGAKDFTLFNAVSLFSIAVTASIIGVYYIFSLYLTSVSRELMTSWVQSEAVEIQEGNLLTSIAKNQRVLLSSQFVKGVVLFDSSTNPPMRLIEVGEKIEPILVLPADSEKIKIVGSGFFKKLGLYQIPNKSDLLLVFDFESGFLRQLFFAAVGVLVLFIVILFGSIKAVQSREFWKREEYLRRALTDLVEQDTASDFVEEKLPFLVQWWKQKKFENEQTKKLAIENGSKILLGELAARVAHDIRSPLNTINAITSGIHNISEDKGRLLKSAIQRIRDIANGIVDQNKQILSRDRLQSANELAITSKTEVLLIFSIIESIVTEKRTQHPWREISLDISQIGYCLFAKINELELKRTLSNLIENAVEATDTNGHIQIILSENKDQILVEIRDNGKGIAPEILPRIGEKGFSIDKESGSGIGVYYAKEVVRRWGGRIEISSQLGLGTTTTIFLRKELPPQWCAEDIRLTKGGTVIIIDDDPTIHAVWRERIGAMAEELNVEHFFDSQSAFSWFSRKSTELHNYKIVTDYDLGTERFNGLELIGNLGVDGRNVILVTNAYCDQGVKITCEVQGIKILPKPLLAHTPIIFN